MMKKAFKITLFVFVSLASLVIIALIAFSILLSVAEKENDKLVEQYQGKNIMISDAESLDKYFFIDADLKSSIISCEANYTPTCIIFGYVPSYYGSGKLTVTEEYYNKLLKSYDDWILLSGFPQTNSPGYYEEDILECADDKFKTFIQTEKYFYSDKMFHSKGRLILPSQEKGEIYFFERDF